MKLARTKWSQTYEWMVDNLFNNEIIQICGALLYV